MPSWSQLAADKQRRQQQAIPNAWLITRPPESTRNVTGVPASCGLLTPRELAITSADVTVLLPKLARGEWSAVEVTTAFYKRALIAQQLVNCLTEIFVERALARAAELDAVLKKTGKVVGPLHGLPVSLKDQLCIKGLETTVGFVSWIGKYAERNAVLVDVLEACGAVPFVKTNVPQAMVWPETLNTIFGRTSNPHNRLLTCGGSSGGEGALVAMRGSPLGVGSDIGGSIRIPAAFCGVYGFKPSSGRVPCGGALSALQGQDSVLSVFGPMTNNVSGLKTFMEAIIKAKPWLKDPLTVRKQWDEDEYLLRSRDNGQRLCFGIMWDDGVCVPHPPIIRALKRVQRALESAGHNVITWHPIKHGELNDLVTEILFAGAVEDITIATSESGEPIISTMAPDSSEGVAKDFRRTKGGITAHQLWQLQKAKKDLRTEYWEHWNNSVESTGTGRPVDAIICPVAPYAAHPHGQNRYVGYTTVWNGLDYPVSVFPVTTVDPTVDARQPRETFIDTLDQEIHAMYDPEVFRDAPICLQLVGRTLEEEAVIAMTDIVDAALKVPGARL